MYLSLVFRNSIILERVFPVLAYSDARTEGRLSRRSKATNCGSMAGKHKYVSIRCAYVYVHMFMHIGIVYESRPKGPCIEL